MNKYVKLEIMIVFLTISFQLSFATKQQEKQKQKAIVYVTLNDSLATENQWVYLFTGIGNETYLPDSVYIRKHQTKFRVSTPVESPDLYSFLCFSKKGPLQAMLQLNKYDRVHVRIDVDNQPPYSTGSKAMTEIYLRDQKVLKTYHTLKRLKEAIIIEFYTYKSKVGNYIDFLKISQNAQNYYIGVLMIENLIPKETSDSIIAVMKKKFPKVLKIQQHPNETPSPKQTQEGKKIHDKVQKIWRARLNIKSDPSPVRKVINFDSIPAALYKVGDKVDNIILPDRNGKYIALYDLKTDYMLIDFWASWCGPCRADVRSILKKYTEYKDKFAIYSITTDENDADWKEAVDFDKSNVFTQVTVNNAKDKYKIVKQFDVKAIPRNFLIDKDHKIIAIDLHGDDLFFKLKELTINK